MIRELYVFVVSDADGTEGVLVSSSDSKAPLIAHEFALAIALTEEAERAVEGTGLTWRLVRFHRGAVLRGDE